MFDNSVLKKTGQWWKACLGFWGVMLGGVLMFVGIRFSQQSVWFIVATVLGSVAGLGFFAFLCRSIRCPKCGAKWYGLHVTKSYAKWWDQLLLAYPICPACKHRFD